MIISTAADALALLSKRSAVIAATTHSTSTTSTINSHPLQQRYNQTSPIRKQRLNSRFISTASNPPISRFIPPRRILNLSPQLQRRSLTTTSPAAQDNNRGFNGFRVNPNQQNQPSEDEKGATLRKYSTDLTELASKGLLDPVIGRDSEIRRIIQILSRRTKSNPIIVGPAGVGKSALMEGLARRLVAGEVPETLKGMKIKSLDLGSLLAGAAHRGSFEERFKNLLKDLEEEQGQTILFIDEVHMLLGLGKAEGSLDAGNMMKPMLARGTLQCVGATTFDEYRNSIEKDAALARRFQPVHVLEPSVSSTLSILRGLRSRYEVHHGVGIKDEALVTAASYAARYLPERKNPDAAIDLIDEAAAALRLQLESKPDSIEALDRKILTLQIELASLSSETDQVSKDRKSKLELELQSVKKDYDDLMKVWVEEKAKIDEIKEVKLKLEEAKVELETIGNSGNQLERAAELKYGIIPDLEKRLPKEEYNQEESSDPTANSTTLLHDRVTSSDIATVVSRITGVPLRNLLRGEREKLLQVEDHLKRRIKGQDSILESIGNSVRLSRAGLTSPKRPLASFLLCGRTGTGKTETCKALAEFLFDDEKSLIQINCSELSEAHSISRLAGAMPGYVGFEDGGQLTEAVRRKPYSIVLFDEIEKAHRSVHQLLLGILEEGTLTDSQGRVVSFKQTILAFTSNLGSELLSLPGSVDQETGEITPQGKKGVEESLRNSLSPEFRNRIDETLIFNQLNREAMRSIVDLRLKELEDRLEENSLGQNSGPSSSTSNVDVVSSDSSSIDSDGFDSSPEANAIPVVSSNRINLQVSSGARDWLAREGYSTEYGARPLNRLIQRQISNPLAKGMIEGKCREGEVVRVELKKEGGEERLEVIMPSRKGK